MNKAIGVRFKKQGKIYYFSISNDINYNIGDLVIVETSRGIECSEIVTTIDNFFQKHPDMNLEPILRIADKQDIEIYKKNKIKETKAFKIALQKIKNYNLPMKLIDVEYTFDNNKLLFYFSSDGRIDFRELVKELASIFKTRIELRQIGVRDEAKLIGGISVCGRVLCCSSFLSEFQPVSIKMAKDQNLSLNPSKISGACGRLMCCLKYEHESYEELLRITPKIGAIVLTEFGKGIVTDLNIITGLLKVSLKENPNATPKIVRRDEITIIKDGSIKIDKDELKALSGLE